MGDPSIKNLVFKDRFSTSDDLLDDLLSEKVSIYEALLEQKKMIYKTKKLKNLPTPLEKGIIKKAKNKTQRNTIF